MTSGSAPGKAILIGEHFVVHGAPALAVPLSRLRLTAEMTATEGPVQDPPGHLGFCVRTVLRELSAPDLAASVVIDSAIPVGSGLGSSAALSVAVIRAAAALLQRPVSPERERALSMLCEREAHGRPSGVDTEVCVTGRPVWATDGRFEALQGDGLARVGLIALYCGPGGATASMIQRVSTFRVEHPTRFAQLAEETRLRTLDARDALLGGDPSRLGAGLTEQHRVLQEVGVSTPALDDAVSAALEAGAAGAKLSGAGGGGLAVAVAPPGDLDDLVARLKAGGQQIVTAGTIA